MNQKTEFDYYLNITFGL